VRSYRYIVIYFLKDEPQLLCSDIQSIVHIKRCYTPPPRAIIRSPYLSKTEVTLQNCAGKLGCMHDYQGPGQRVRDRNYSWIPLAFEVTNMAFAFRTHINT